MKKLSALAFAFLFFLPSCVDVALPTRDRSPHPATEKDLAGKRFVLQTLDGTTIEESSGSGYDLEFNKDLYVFAKGCNRFSGKAKLQGNILSAPNAGSTRMFCTGQQESTMDEVLKVLFNDGAPVVMERGKLKISVAGHDLVYILSNFSH